MKNSPLSQALNDVHKVDFFDPLLVYLKLKEVDDIKYMIKEWKKEHLKDKVLELYNKTPEKVSKLKLYINAAKLFVKYCWPVLIVSIIVNYSILSAILISIPLIPLQLFIWFYMLNMFSVSIGIVAVQLLEKNQRNKE